MEIHMQRSREEEIRTNLSLERVVSLIEGRYLAKYDPGRQRFDGWDQLLACEALDEATSIIEKSTKEIKELTSVSGVLNDTCKHRVIFELTQSKKQTIAQLCLCDYRTQPVKTADYLKELFYEWPSKQSHWLYITQNWTALAINRTVRHLVKLQQTGRKTIINPPAYFTYLIKLRKKRKG